MSTLRYQTLGALQAGQSSRAVLGLAISADHRAEPVVLIWVPQEALTDAPLLAKIRREVEHASRLDHPNIVRVLGLPTVEDRQARVVEFADGEPLRKILDRAKKLPPRIAARIVCDACTGTHYAHIAGNDDGTPLVHGDLRPETLLISFNGTTKVTGYGALAFAPRDMGGHKVGGRRAYSAPEQIIGGREAITIPTDVYLLGLTLYECLTGIIPWADQADFFDQAVLTHPLPPAPPGDIAPELEKVLQRACAKKAPERYTTPFALREAIERVVGTEIASPAELAGFLSGLFPESESLRADRKRTIDAGIADFVRRQWQDGQRAKSAPATTPAPMPLAPSPPEVKAPPQLPPEPPAPLQVQVAPRASIRRPAGEPEEATDKPTSMPWVIVAALAVAAGGIGFGIHTANQPLPSKHDGAQVQAAPNGTPELSNVSIAADGGTRARDAGGAVTATDAGAPASAKEALVAAVVPVEAAIACEPPVELTIDGVAAGRTPWKGRLTPGKHTLKLQNRELGVLAQRTLAVKGDAPISESYSFEKGFVAVTAPEGSQILIDGVRKGAAPITGEIPIYEGSHRIDVNIGQSRWGQSFQLEAAQRVRFNVEFE